MNGERTEERVHGQSLRRLLVGALLATACAADAVATEQPLPSQTMSAEVTGTESVGSEDVCPLTIPPQPGFVPPEPYPREAPALYQAVWYGTSELWTMLRPEGEVWAELPTDNGIFGQKTFWWSDGYSPIAHPPITVTGRQLDGSESFEAGGPGTNGFRKDISSFMLVGIGIPAAGCWEVTAQYRDAELTYVVAVEG
jgi:hypothetical protein